MYKLGRTKAERQAIFENIVDIYTNKGLSLEDIAKEYDVTKQAISLFLRKRGFYPNREEDLKKIHIKNKINDEAIKAKLSFYNRRRNSQSWEKYTLEKKVEELEKKLRDIQVLCIVAKEIGIDKITDYFDKIIKICEV